MPARNLSILFLCQLISATGTIVMVTLGGIIGSTLSGNPALATLPVSMMVVCVAATTIPATMLMRRIGRRKGFMLASLSAAFAVFLATIALSQSSFVIFGLAAGLFGINMAFTQQYRFAAAESVQRGFTGRAISLVLVGSIGGAMIGPELVIHGQQWVEGVPYSGTLATLAGLYLLQCVLFYFLGAMHSDNTVQSQSENRSSSEIVRQPVFLMAVLSGEVAYVVMTLLKTATPISMHVNDGFPIDETARVIRAHVLGMYVPSLFSGYLMDRIGPVRIMMAGVIALACASLVALQGHAYLHYWYSLILLGIGWNFLYVGATTMLTLTYAAGERFRAQAINEFTVFGTSATASLLAGTVLYYFGWSTLIILPLLPLALVLAGLFVVRRNHLLRRAETVAN
ncbi:MAG: MFS transporter [Woeseiaceae bacterium]